MSEYHMQYRYTTPVVRGQFWFAVKFDRDDICLNQELQVSVPEGRDVKGRTATV